MRSYVFVRYVKRDERKFKKKRVKGMKGKRIKKKEKEKDFPSPNVYETHRQINSNELGSTVWW